MLLLSLLAPSVSFADPTTQSAESASISDQIKSEDPPQIEEAVVRIKALFEPDPEGTVQMLVSDWLPALWDAKRYDRVAALSRLALPIAPHLSDAMEKLQLYRTKGTFYVGGKTYLACARGLYNISSLD